MKKITDSIESAIANVQTAFPSIFTKEDVVSILEGLHTKAEEEVVVSSVLNDEQIDELVEMVKEAVSRKLNKMDCSDLVDYSTAEFEINYGNTLELTEVSVNVDSIEEEVHSEIEDKIKSYFETFVIDEEVETGTPYATEQ